jgi:hypothetical protein
MNNAKILFIVSCVVIFLTLKNLGIYVEGVNSTLLSGILGIVGGLLGTLVYRIIENKKAYIKYGVLFGICLAVFACLFFFKPKKEKKFDLVDFRFGLLDSSLQKAVKEPKDFRVPELSEEERGRLITCEICGYKSLYPDSSVCYNCFGEVFDASLYRPNEKTSWLKNEQVKHFVIGAESEPINFYKPKTENGFSKDPLWKPALTDKETKENYKKFNGDK